MQCTSSVGISLEMCVMKMRPLLVINALRYDIATYADPCFFPRMTRRSSAWDGMVRGDQGVYEEQNVS